MTHFCDYIDSLLCGTLVYVNSLYLLYLFAISSINRSRKGGRKRKQKKSNITKDRIDQARRRLTDSENSSKSGDDTGGELSEEEIEFYGGNTALPVYSKSRKVLSPAETVGLLTDRGAFHLSKVCHRQPLQVQHHRTFIVDLTSLQSPQDVKCDDMGSWRNNSSSKFTFDVEWNEGEIKMLTPVRKGCHKSSVILKREYFILNHNVENDLRKRIDTIVCKYRTQYSVETH